MGENESDGARGLTWTLVVARNVGCFERRRDGIRRPSFERCAGPSGDGVDASG